MANHRTWKIATGRFIGTAALLLAGTAHAQTYDTIIRGGTIVDGSGLSSYKGDVSIEDKRIVAVGNLGKATAKEVIDANGLDQQTAWVQVDVSDNGIGFDEKHVDRIFQMFQRLHTQDHGMDEADGIDQM